MKLRALVLFSLITCAAFAQDDFESPIPRGTLIEVERYDSQSHTYDIVMVEEEAQGPNYATVEDLVRAVKALTKLKLATQPKSIVGQKYVLDSDLQLQPVLKTEAKMKRNR